MFFSNFRSTFLPQWFILISEHESLFFS